MYWFIKCLKQYADFSGRARRKEYWMFTLFVNLILFPWAVIGQFIANSGGSIIPIILFFIATLALTVPGLSVTVRRMHDHNKSGWMYLINLIPIVGGVWFFILTILPGTEGYNDYGPDPLEEDEYY